MTLFQIVQSIIFTYVGLSFLVALYIGYFQVKYKTPRDRYEIGRSLEKIRGKKTVLLPLQVFSWIFLALWLALALPFIDFAVHLNWVSTYENGTFTTWVGSFKGEQGNYYFGTIFIGILGTKGFFVISYISNVLKDKTLSVKRNGNLGYTKEL